MSASHRQSVSGNAVGRLLRSTWRYKGLIVAAVLLGALIGYGWAARQPVLYEGVARVLPLGGSGGAYISDGGPPAVDRAQNVHNQAQFISSQVVLERAVKLSGNRISVETLRQRLEVDAAKDVDMLTVRVVDLTATGAAQLANAVVDAYDQVLAQQWRQSLHATGRQLQSTLRARLAEMDAKLARDPNDPVLRAQRAAAAEELSAITRQLMKPERYRPSLAWERAAVPKQPITPGPGRAIVMGMLVGLLVSAVLVWWRTGRQGPPYGASASEQGPDMPSLA